MGNIRALCIQMSIFCDFGAEPDHQGVVIEMFRSACHDLLEFIEYLHITFTYSWVDGVMGNIMAPCDQMTVFCDFGAKTDYQGVVIEMFRSACHGFFESIEYLRITLS